MSEALPSGITKIKTADAALPQKYEAARTALAECERIDECRDWADKAIALASYARQANDTELENFAVRIKARAIDRVSELLAEFDARPQNNPSGLAGGTQTDSTVDLGRTAAARAAGLSERQQQEASRFRKLDRDEFESAVESDNPRERLRALLTKPKPKGFSKATTLLGVLRELTAFCNSSSPVDVADALSEQELVRVRAWLSEIDAWFTEFINQIGD